ncbi:MAG TPA: GspE/PulE family protein [Nitrospira sp.]|nr:GspE/PulE family protein [Nitrospira sp.]
MAVAQRGALGYQKSEMPTAGVRKASASPQFRQTWERSIKDYLIYRGVVGQAELDAAIEEVVAQDLDLESVLVHHQRRSRQELGSALSQYYRCPFMAFDERLAVESRLLKNLNRDYLKANAWLPMRREGNEIHVLSNDPHDLEKRCDIQRAFPGAVVKLAVGLRCDIEMFLANATGRSGRDPLADILEKLAEEAGQERISPAELMGVNENDSIIAQLVNHVIAEAYRLGASDIHVEPSAGHKDTMVRFRVDGTCFTPMRIPAPYRRAVVSRIKIMANLDIAESRKPQDGKIAYRPTKDREIELRVATLPTSGGIEDVVLRLLTAKEPMRLDGMGLTPNMREAIEAIAQKPYGIFLCVGPTGSGKTTTLHAVLQSINTDERKIWTAEDPIEITQEGLRQVQIHQKIGLTFASAMRAFLRADPDVIMIGEMRDKETADVAIEASLTGHLVLSTLHTNSAVETVVRLLDLGCDSFNFADAMVGVLAQRLCKRLCAYCKETYPASQQEYDELVHGYGAGEWSSLGVEQVAAVQLYRGRGCDLCNHTGFQGRVAIHELLLGSDGMKGLVQGRANTSVLFQQAKQDGMRTLVQDGIRKVLQGDTTYRQVRAVALK